MLKEDFEHLFKLEENFWWFAGMREITSALLDPFCPPTPTRAVLDAGCGTGGNLEWLKRYAGDGNVFGIDVSPDALKFVRSRNQELVAGASATALPFGDSHFDLVTSFDVLGQLPHPGGDELALAEMSRVLRPNGVLFLRVAAYEWLRSSHDEALQTRHRYALPELLSLLERSGLSVLRATYANSLLLPGAALRRLVLKRIRLAGSGSDVQPLPDGSEWLNRLLKRILLAEARYLRKPRNKLPAGLSTICIAQKTETPADPQLEKLPG
ncbi:MAG TPA: class I SAM-dependent methyltransferase [Pyrinomonadaceae bacterium]|nr:class I SAM-dependent methyltransferase [Pyrinomonadaceae bacterium]